MDSPPSHTSRGAPQLPPLESPPLQLSQSTLGAGDEVRSGPLQSFLPDENENILNIRPGKSLGNLLVGDLSVSSQLELNSPAESSSMVPELAD